MMLVAVLFPVVVEAQENNDSIAFDFRSFVAKNFSRYRTMNFSYETKPTHEYVLSAKGNEIERGKKTDLHTIRFSTMIPLVKMRNVSFYANCSYSCYKFQNDGDRGSSVFRDDGYDYYYGGFNGSYYAMLFSKPLILSAELAVDGWDKGWGKIQALASVLMVLKNEERTKFSAGLMGMTLFSSTPVIPVIGYWHRFSNPDWSIDISLPSQMYVRYQREHHRFSMGAKMSAESFYVSPAIEDVPSLCFYKEAMLSPEVLYEYIISRHFYVSARAGLSVVLKSGLYTENRKEIEIVDVDGECRESLIVEQKRSPIPFVHVGLSYSLFK